jgi:hypothetical protein
MVCRCRHVYGRRGGESVRGTGTPLDPYIHDSSKIRCLQHPYPAEFLIEAEDTCLSLPPYIEELLIDRAAPAAPISLGINSEDHVIVNSKAMQNFSLCGINPTPGRLGEIYCVPYFTPSKFQIDVLSVGDLSSPELMTLQMQRNRLSRPVQDQPYMTTLPGNPEGDGLALLYLPQFAREADYTDNISVIVDEHPGSEVTVMPLGTKPFYITRNTHVLTTVMFSISTSTIPQLNVDPGANPTGSYTGAYEAEYNSEGSGGSGAINGEYSPEYSNEYSGDTGDSGSTNGGPFLTEDATGYLAQEDNELLFQEETPYVFPLIDSGMYWNFLLQRKLDQEDIFTVGAGSQSLASPTPNETWFTFYDLVRLSADTTYAPDISYTIKTDKIYKGLNSAYFFEVNWFKVHFQFI